MNKKLISTIGASLLVISSVQANAVPYNVLWWDSTPTYGGQAPDSLRKEMSDYLTAYNGGSVFNSTYVSSETAGTLAALLATNSYSVIIFDSTSSTQKFNAADLLAIQNHYSTKSNLLLDGDLYVRSINYNATSDFPGINNSTGSLTLNEVHQLAVRGGGIMIGTDHQGYQVDANQALTSVIPTATFSGITYPSTDGVFFGSDLLNDLEPIAAADIFAHWDSIPTQAIAPTGAFTDIFGRSVNLYSQVDVADDPGGGTRYSYISTSWKPGSGTTDVDDDTPGGDGTVSVPEPNSLVLLLCGLGMTIFSRRKLVRSK